MTQANIELEIERHIRQVSHQMKIVDWRKQWEQPERRAGSVRKSVWKNGRGRQAGGYQLRLVSEKTRFPTAVVRNTKGEILGEYKTPNF